MLATPDKFTTTANVVRLLRHEVLRVFFDRLVGEADKEFVSTTVEEALRATFPEDAEGALQEPCLFGDFLLYNEIEEAKNGGGSGDLVRLYEDMADYTTIKPVRAASSWTAWGAPLYNAPEASSRAHGLSPPS